MDEALSFGLKGLCYLGPTGLSLEPNSKALLGCSGDLVSRLSNRPYRAYYPFVWWQTGDTKLTYSVK